MSGTLPSPERVVRSLRFRTRQAKRLAISLGKHFRPSSAIDKTPLLDAASVCNSREEFLSTTQDAVWRAFPGQRLPSIQPKHVFASHGVRNREALASSLAEGHFDTPELVVGRFHECVAEPTSIRAVTRAGRLISETSTVHDLLDPHLRDSDHLVMRRSGLRQLADRYESIEADALFAFNSISASYGHFILTGLTLASLFRDEIAAGSLKIVIPDDTPRWMTSRLIEFGIEEPALLRLQNRPYRFKSVIVSNILDACNTRAPNPASLRWASKLTQEPHVSAHRARRVYVRRSDSGNLSTRTIQNEPDVLDAMTSEGFEIIEPAALSLQQQAAAFGNADIVVSQHGSTFANLIFCRPGTRVLDLMPDDWVGIRGDRLRDVWAARLCDVGGLRYSVMLCPSTIESVHHSGNATMRSRVPVADLVEITRRIAPA
jgi:capsular polysaccharide biosynthesis protein